MAGGTLVVRIIGDIREFQAQMASLGARLRMFGQQASAMGSRILGVVTPLALAGGAAAKMSMEFEESMDRIIGLVGVSRDQVDRWREDVLSLAEDLPLAPKELADALFFVTSAGIRGAQAMDVLETGARAASAGLGDLPTVLDAVTSAMNSYRQSGLSATEATDVMVAAVREGKMAAEDLAPVLGGVLPVASQLGVEFHEVAAAIASATRQGLEASRAATGVRFLLSAFTRPSNEAKEALAGIGLSLAELQRSLAERGLLATMQTLAERFDLSTARGRELFATVVGGARGMSVASILVGQNAEKVEGVFGSLADAAGSTARAFKVASEDTQFTWGSAMSSLEVAAIRVGDALAPIVVQIAHALAGLGEVLQDIDPGVIQAVATAILGLAGVGAALKVIGGLASAFGSLLSIAGALASPMGLVIVALGGLAAAAISAADGLGGLQGILEAARELLGRVLEAVTPVVEAVGGFLVQAARRVWATLEDDVLPALGRLWEALGDLVEALSPVFEAAGRLIQILGRLALAALPVVVDAIGLAIDIVARLIDWFARLITWVGRVVNWVGDRLAAAWGVAEEAIDAVRDAIGWVISKIKSLIDWVGEAIDWLERLLGLGPAAAQLGGMIGSRAGRGGPVPQLAHGGVVTRPTLAFLGEEGPEVVIPLREHTAFDAERIGRAIAAELIRRERPIILDRRSFVRAQDVAYAYGGAW